MKIKFLIIALLGFISATAFAQKGQLSDAQEDYTTYDALKTQKALDSKAAQSLADAILRLAKHPDECTRLQQKGRERATHFSIAQCTRNLDDAREQILRESTVHV